MSAPPATCIEVARAVQSGARSAVDVTNEALTRAGAFQEKYRSFIRLTPEVARAQAETVDRRVKSGAKLPLAGVPFALKDLFHVAGVPTTYGSKVFGDVVQRQTATAVSRLIDAGAVLIGKASLHECAFGFTGANRHFGDCRNPWDAERIPGGSSSGSGAALALGICPLAIGSDTGGSIRLPAALCGVTGLKPTYGRVSRMGGFPLSWTMDHVGPMTRTAADAAVALRVMAGHDPADESSSRRAVPDYQAELTARIRGLRIGVMHQWFFEALDPEVAAAMTKALETLKGLGAVETEVHLPLLEEALGAHRAIIFPEASAFHAAYLERSPALYGDDIRALLLGGRFLSAVDYLQAQRVRRRVRREWATVFDSIDALLTPTSPIAAPKFGDETANLPGGPKPLLRAFLDVTLPFNLSGNPALAVPCGFTKAGLPLGMQLVGKPFSEGTLLRIAHQYQQETEWHRRMPALPAS
jgi:aspartyl-tRNA(Asn)/glutamyl-tRNA(Gln) amidotransferase subunit A